MSNLRLSYRPEIDGLRAIAVISVILYHAQFILFGRDLFEGGYIGVDIFFVISGYLITRIILSELQSSDTFRFVNFYERRARRILPMLFVVILASIPYAWYRMLPGDFFEYAQSILASIFFGSNFFFYFSTIEYGADSALLKPFLHTWSLSVEEQFYFIFPAIAILTFKFLRPYFYTVLVLLSFISLIFSDILAVQNANLNFYLPFSRFWELTAGSIIAYRELLTNRKKTSVKEKDFFSILGILLILFAIFSFDKNTAHPSLWTLIPILGVMLLIEFTTKETLIGKVLSSSLFVSMGLISYSAYLWHFPIFAFNRADGFGNIEKLSLIFFTIFLSFISYRYIETLFRSNNLITKKSFIFFILFFGISISVFMTAAIFHKGFEERFTASQIEFLNLYSHPEFNALKDPKNVKGLTFKERELSLGCYNRSPEDACQYGKEKIVFLGDSYVGHYERAFIEKFRLDDWGFMSLTYGQCPFLTMEIWFGNRSECPEINELRRKKIRLLEDQKVFIISANEKQFNASKLKNDISREENKNILLQTKFLDPDVAWNSYFSGIEWLLSLGHKVVLIRSLPNPNINAQAWLSLNKKYIDDKSFPNIANKDKPSTILHKDYKIYPNFDNENIIILDPSHAMCDLKSDRCFDVLSGKGPLYNGGRHLSYIGAEVISDFAHRAMIEKGWHHK